MLLAPAQPVQEADRSIKGWLVKRKSDKSGYARKLLSKTNRRFFTLDYPSKLFYYAHSENEKTISRPILVRDICEVEPLDVVGDCEAERDGLACSFEAIEESREKSSSSPSMSSKPVNSYRFRVPSFGTIRGSGSQHGFVLHIKSPEEEKWMELLCSSKAEAQQWIAALDFAIRITQLHFSPLTASALLAFTGSGPCADLSDKSTEASGAADWLSDISCR